MAKMTEESIMQLVRSQDVEDLQPEDTDRAEEAIGDLHRASLEGKYSFINVIVLAVVLLACAAYFITMTSGDRYGDREIEISPSRLADGSFTAELSRRYYSTVAYPEQIDKLYEKLTSFYGITGEGKESAEKLREELEITPPEDHSRPTTTKKPHIENEITTTTAASGEDTLTTTVQTDPEEHGTVYSRTTTVSTTLDFDPNDPYKKTTAKTTTTTNNTAPPATSTTTAPAVTTTKPTCKTEPPPPVTEVPPDDSSGDDSHDDSSSDDSSEIEPDDSSEIGEDIP